MGTRNAVGFGPGAIWIGAIYVLVWALSSYVANRIRSSEHALRTLNASLETRVREQVTALERAHRLRRYLAPQLADEILLRERLEPSGYQLVRVGPNVRLEWREKDAAELDAERLDDVLHAVVEACSPIRGGAYR